MGWGVEGGVCEVETGAGLVIERLSSSRRRSTPPDITCPVRDTASHDIVGLAHQARSD